MKRIKIRDEYITLGQFLKLANVVSSGVEGKMMILDGLVKVNQKVEKRRGKKLRVGDIISVNHQEFIIE